MMSDITEPVYTASQVTAIRQRYEAECERLRERTAIQKQTAKLAGEEIDRLRATIKKLGLELTVASLPSARDVLGDDIWKMSVVEPLRMEINRLRKQILELVETTGQLMDQIPDTEALALVAKAQKDD